MLSSKFIQDVRPKLYALENRFERIEKSFGLPSFNPREKGYLALKKTIVGQQLSIASAAAIWNRFVSANLKDEKILSNQADKELRMGMSVSVKIDTKHKPEVPLLIKPFANIG